MESGFNFNNIFESEENEKIRNKSFENDLFGPHCQPVLESVQVMNIVLFKIWFEFAFICYRLIWILEFPISETKWHRWEPQTNGRTNSKRHRAAGCL